MSRHHITGTVEIAPQYLRTQTDVIVRLEDTTMLDGLSETVAETACRLDLGRGTPAPFHISVEEKLVDRHRQYSLSARSQASTVQGAAAYGTVQNYPWRTGDKAMARLELKKLN